MKLDPNKKLYDYPDREFQPGGYFTELLADHGLNDPGCAHVIVNNFNWWGLTATELMRELEAFKG